MRILRLWLTKTGMRAGWFAGCRIVIPVVLGLSLLNQSVLAQNACLNPLFKGEFSLDKPRVCVGEPVNIIGVPTSLTNIGYNQQYDGNGIPATYTATTRFTYAKPGSYTIIQVGSGNGTGAGTIACRVVTVLPLDPVKFTLKACSGKKVTLTPDVPSLGQYDRYIIRWGDGQVETKTQATLAAGLEHTYSGGISSPIIAVEGEYGPADNPLCGSAQSTQTISLLASATQPAITRLTTLSDNSISIQFQGSASSTIQLYQKDASGTYNATTNKVAGSGTFTVTTNAKQVQCFQVVAQDACNNSSNLSSDEVCSLVLDAKAANKQNNLTWQPYAGIVSANKPFRYYRILRNGSPVGGTLTNQSTNAYADNNQIECGKSYCYALEATINATTQTVITSAPICVMGSNGDAPSAIGNIVVSIENNHPRLVAGIPATGSSYTMTVARSTGSGNTFQPVGTVVGRNTFVDESADASAGQYCYQLTYQTNCGLTSPPSTPVCTVFLTSRSPAAIDWTTDSPFSTSELAGYTLEVIDSLNGTRREIILGSNTHYEPDPSDPNLQSQKYRVIAISKTGTTSYSNFYTFRREGKLLVPDAFTPNGDGMNDEFILKGFYVDQFKMSVYDRWGEVIYSTTDKTKGWDGMVNGQAAAAGQYMYRLEVQDLTGQKTVRTGAVLLIR